MNTQEAQNIKWSENIIIVDGDYIDHVAFDIIVNYDKELNGQAFMDERFGEFIINSIACGDENTAKDAVLLDLLKTLCIQDEVKRIMIVPNAEEDSLLRSIRNTLNDVDDELKHITLFAMQPLEGGNFKQAILGYSILNAMGISSPEIESKIK